MKAIAAPKRRKGARLKFKPPQQKAIATRIAQDLDKTKRLHDQHKAAQLRVKGASFEDIAEKMGISTNEAFALVSEATNRWVGELQLSTIQVRELQLRECQALKAILWKELRPKIMADDDGNPILDAITGEIVLENSDKFTMKMLLEVMDRESRLMGTEAKDKMSSPTTVNLIQRMYVGCDPESL